MSKTILITGASNGFGCATPEPLARAATNKPVHGPFAHRWQIRDGKLARFDMYTDTLLIDRAMR